jgi:hypothetical protein
MPTTTDITTVPLSGLNHIDALLDRGPDWNFLTSAAGNVNVLNYTFSISSGTEGEQSNVTMFSAAQQAGVRSALQYLTAVTGIQFVETGDGLAAQVHFCGADLEGTFTSGLCSWRSSYSSDSRGNLVSYDADAYVYLDNASFATMNANLTAGSGGYETLLHELGHMLGLKHPFEDTATLPSSRDNTQYTVMSYTHVGGTDSVFEDYDLAALNWLYGGDGLGGALGIGSVTGARYLTGSEGADSLTGTAANDLLQGVAGNDTLDGGDGTDTAVFSGVRAAYQFLQLDATTLQVSGSDGSDRVANVEWFQFDDARVSLSALVDTQAPSAPTLAVEHSGGYATVTTPRVSGSAEALATVRVYNGLALVGSTQADSAGQWSLTTSALPQGVATLRAGATDAAGNMSVLSGAQVVTVDSVAPAVPGASVARTLSGAVAGNQPLFSGTGEAGSTITLVNLAGGARTVLEQVTVGAGGSWSVTPDPLANGSYDIGVEARDAAGNLSTAPAHLVFTLADAGNTTGSDAGERLQGTAANNALDGQGGLDTVVYGGLRGAYTISAATPGFTVASAGDGRDTLVNVERIQFADTNVALDVVGNGGKAYRLYQAAFDRSPDKPGLGFWIDVLDRGHSLDLVASEFIASKEFSDTYGANLTDNQFVHQLYQNVLHRTPDAGGFAFWTGRLADGAQRSAVLAAFSESPENQAQLIGVMQNGFEYTPYA